jgi:23S rRNA (cytidine1920-2'-O)/16S rRNA (cytidine1409-2'-O)-methyltransferase
VTRRQRLDTELVRRGLVASRSEASSLIDEHRVLVNGAIADKSSRLVDPGDAVVVSGPPARSRRPAS